MKPETMYDTTVYFARTNDATLTVGSVGKNFIEGTALQELSEHRGIILWECNGLFRIIPINIICNVLQLWESVQRLREYYPRLECPRIEFTWSQGIDVSDQVVKRIWFSSPE